MIAVRLTISVWLSNLREFEANVESPDHCGWTELGLLALALITASLRKLW